MYFYKQTVVLKFSKIWNLSLYKADFIYSQDAPFVFFTSIIMLYFCSIEC